MAVLQTERWDEIVAAGDAVATTIELLKRFLRDYPENGPAWWYFGRKLVEVSRFDEAEAALRKAIDLSRPDSLHFVYRQMGCVFRHRGNLVIAEEWYRKAIEAAPDDAGAYIFLGAMLARRGNLPEAEEVHRRATHCRTGDLSEAHHNLGLVLRAQESYEEAYACFEAALKTDPRYKEAKVALRDVRRAMRVGLPEASDLEDTQRGQDP
jgi:protein O-GlcNAc transferase